MTTDGQHTQVNAETVQASSSRSRYLILMMMIIIFSIIIIISIIIILKFLKESSPESNLKFSNPILYP